MSQLVHDPQAQPVYQNDYSLALNSTELLYQLMYFRFICYKLKLIDVNTFHTSLSISHG